VGWWQTNKKEVKEGFIKKITANVQNTHLEEVEYVNEIRLFVFLLLQPTVVVFSQPGSGL